MNAEQMKAYEVPTDSFWQALPMMGVSGYDAIELAERRKWAVISAWGQDGWDLGTWPLVMVFFRNLKMADGTLVYQIAYYVEGDVVLYGCPTEAIRNEVTDFLAFFHWKWQDEAWVREYESVEQLPAELRGPYWNRQEHVS